METQTTNYKKYNSKNKLKIIMIKKFQKKLSNLLQNEIKNCTLLDAGCGEGFMSNYIYNNTGIKNITGIDNNKEAIDYAIKNNKKIKYKTGDIYNLKYSNEDFDIVIALEVLEHLSNPQQALLEIIRVAKKKVIISVPNEPYFSLGNLLSFKNIKRLGNPPDHINKWSKKKFLKFIKNNIGEEYNTSCITSFPWTIIIIEK